MMMIALIALVAAAEASPGPTPFASAPATNCAPATAFSGTICTPAGNGKHPAMLLLGGSEGGDSMARVAMVFAGDGYVAASVAYFGLPGLPQSLQLVPVETVGKALTAIARRSDVDPHRIGAFGVSKGGEFVLLAASTYPAIHAVVADVPSPFAWEGIPAGATSTHDSSWTVGGKPLPFVPFTDALGVAFGKAFSTHTPLALRPAYDAAMQNDAAADAAAFHLENIDGPVLFFGAGDDQIWNSVALSRRGLAYLKARGHTFADASQEFPDAGHLFLFATPDRPLVDAPFAAGLTLELGGTAQANVSAAAQAWPRMLTFLREALSGR
jgi:dienelactone hydrolase